MDIPSPKDVGARYPRKRSDQERYEEAQTALNRHIRKIINEISAFLRDPRQSRPHMAFQGASFYIGSADGWPTLNMTDPNCTKEIAQAVAEAFAKEGWSTDWGPRRGRRTAYPFCVIVLPKNKYGHLLNWA